MRHKRVVSLLLLTLAVALLCAACASASPVATSAAILPDSSAETGAPASPVAVSSEEYDAQTITIEGLPDGDATLTIRELRALPQHHLDASYKRTTGLYEEFSMDGAYLSDVIALAGGDLSDYEGVGVMGSDGYYCLVSREVVEATPDLMLALTIDDSAELSSGVAPAQLAAQGQLGPYWVKMVSTITLYTDIPEKDISSVWVFDNLAEGITPVEYDYYGSKDHAIDLEQIWSRLDDVDTDAFFTMKSSDGFLKNEAMSMVLRRYYIKTDGEDAPTNISLNVQLGMNVQHIAWFSSNADAMIFPVELEKYLTTRTIGEETGVPLDEILYEVQVEALRGVTFDLLGTEGEKVTVPGEDLSKGILVVREDGSYAVVWQDGAGYEKIPDLMRVRRASTAAGAPDEGGVTHAA